MISRNVFKVRLNWLDIEIKRQISFLPVFILSWNQQSTPEKEIPFFRVLFKQGYINKGYVSDFTIQGKENKDIKKVFIV